MRGLKQGQTRKVTDVTFGEESAAHQRIITAQAIRIDQLEAEIAGLKAAMPKTLSEPLIRKARRGNKKPRTLCQRVALSQSWTPARRATASKRMSDYWQLERATRPDHAPNGSLI